MKNPVVSGKIKPHQCPACNRLHFSKEASDVLDEHFRKCAHCQLPIHYEYMVEDTVWEQAGMGKFDGVLHLECLEGKLRRSLKKQDFKPVPSNGPILWALEQNR